MPCGKESVYHFQNHNNAAWVLTQKLRAGAWFGFAEVDIEIPVHLRPKYDEMCPFFLNKEVPLEAVPQHMKDLQQTGRKRVDGKKLLGALSANKLLLYAPLLRWHIDHRAHISQLYRTINFEPAKIFPWCVEKVTGECLEEVVRPAMREEFEADKKNWLAWDK